MDWGALVSVGAVIVSFGGLIVTLSRNRTDRALGIKGHKLAEEELDNSTHAGMNKTLLDELKAIKVEQGQLKERNDELSELVHEFKARDFIWQQRERQLTAYIHARWGQEGFPILLDLPPLK